MYPAHAWSPSYLDHRLQLESLQKLQSMRARIASQSIKTSKRFKDPVKRDGTYPTTFKFQHYSSTRSRAVPLVRPVNLGTGNKPSGCLWLSWDNQWKELSTSGKYGWPDQLMYEHAYTVAMAGLLILDTEEKLIDFYRRFGLALDAPGRSRGGIDWNKVRKQYSAKCGVMLPRPHKYENVSAKWLDGYDVGSVVLWSEQCLVAVEFVREIMFKEKQNPQN